MHTRQCAAAGLLQLPVSWLGIRALNGNFTAINVAQIIFLLPIFIFCWMMHKCAAPCQCIALFSVSDHILVMAEGLVETWLPSCCSNPSVTNLRVLSACRWSTENLVPIRPMEGQELPMDMVR
jgi:hypothetical protein